ncbi:unnamed protein product [Effrenium voratum]|uniref:CPW-WPC domain-containing protein n=1 Tax=Effrenium voratum TaxID=2562239 RepID=A0AA36J439_9DINO|nr:unnamed protein product [Effrenium voratum]
MNKPQPTPARYPSHAPGQPPAWQCTRNFNRTCPDGFNFDGAMCHEDGSYINPSMTNCAHFDARRWTNQMKEAFGEHCHVWWPCKASQRSGTQNLRNGPVRGMAARCAVRRLPVGELSMAQRRIKMLVLARPQRFIGGCPKLKIQSPNMVRRGTIRIVGAVTALQLALQCTSQGGESFVQFLSNTPLSSAPTGSLTEHREFRRTSLQGPAYVISGLVLAGVTWSVFRRRTTGFKSSQLLSSKHDVLIARVQVIGACCIIILQYALLQIFGIYSQEMLTAGEANKLYAAANWGACALAAPAGLCFDALGPAWSSLLGGLFSSMGLAAAALALARPSPSIQLASAGYLAFGFGATLLNTVGLLAAVRAAPPKQSGKIAAGVLCALALGMSFHTAVHAKWFRGLPWQFLQYQIIYSIFAGLLGVLVFRSRAWTLAVQEDVQESREVEATDSSNSVSSPWSRIRGILSAKEFPWLAAVHLVPIAFSFAWLGNWTVCAQCLHLPSQDQIRQPRMPPNKGRQSVKGCVGMELGFLGSTGLFLVAFILLLFDQRRWFEAAMQLMCLGYGGVLCLAPVALRSGFAAEDLGTVFGLLYQCLAVTFTIFNWAAVPSRHCAGSSCFKEFFVVSGVLHAGCTLWAAARLARSLKRKPDPCSPRPAQA